MMIESMHFLSALLNLCLNYDPRVCADCNRMHRMENSAAVDCLLTAYVLCVSR